MNSDLIERVHLTSPALTVTLQVLEHSDVDTHQCLQGDACYHIPASVSFGIEDCGVFFVLESENFTWVLCAKPCLVESRSRVSWILLCDAYGGEKTTPNTPKKLQEDQHLAEGFFVAHLWPLERSSGALKMCLPRCCFLPRCFSWACSKAGCPVRKGDGFAYNPLTNTSLLLLLFGTGMQLIPASLMLLPDRFSWSQGKLLKLGKWIS